MNFYLAALNKQIKKENENDALGVIMCTSKDEDVVKFTMNNNDTTKVSNYSLSLIDKKLLENRLKEIKYIIEGEKV